MRFKIGPIDFTQPPTWRGLLGFAGLFGVSISPELADKIAIAVGMGLSAIEVFRDEDRAHSVSVKDVTAHSTQCTDGPNRQVAAATAAVITAADPDRLPLRDSRPTEPEPLPLESAGFGDR